MRAVRCLGGVATGGVVVVTIAVVVAAVVGCIGGFPGPGAPLLCAHIPAAAVAVGAIHYADRHAGWYATVVSPAAVAVAVAVLWWAWLE